MGNYKLVDGLPQNPVGRTGLTGRGLLGKFKTLKLNFLKWKMDVKIYIYVDS